MVISGAPGDTVSESVVSPEEYLDKADYQLNHAYYIERNINQILSRSLSACGIDVNVWFQKYPRKRWNLPLHNNKPFKPLIRGNSARLDRYYQSAHCMICKSLSKIDICEACSNDTQKMSLGIMSALNKQERKFKELNYMCRACTGCVADIECVSLDCPIHLEKSKIKREFQGKMFRLHKNLNKNI